LLVEEFAMVDLKDIESVLAYNGNRYPKIDLHSHFIPVVYSEALESRGEKYPDGFKTPKYKAEGHLSLMKRLGIQHSMISISSPHINIGDEKDTANLARRTNDFGFELQEKYQGKFRLMASLPAPYKHASIEEINRCASQGVDGFALPTNTRGVYLGSDDFDPILEKLNEIAAVIVLHPNKPGAVPENVNEGLPIPTMEFFFDTTRTITDMIVKGIFRKYPEIRFVVPHAGAFLPLLADRLVLFFELSGKMRKGTVYGILQKLYYDLAGASVPRQLESLLRIVAADHLLYGSDNAYTPELACIYLADKLDKTDLLNEEQRKAIYWDNAINLFPRLNKAT
jgi:predicted TIM-barrel fold metal-dependent hydrolase